MFAFFAPGTRADTVAYGEAFDTLYRINLTSHTATPVGQAGVYGGQRIGNVSGLSYSTNDTLYAVAGGMIALSRIDPSNGAATILGPFGLAGQGGFIQHREAALDATVDGDDLARSDDQ